ncbi:MAG: hypothetical protein Q8S00_28130 [Deltaproteobacteria bacterium]|nr:hypothetical protein [Deltaproteobacteria bacterium]MDZ4341633.1 hypothetical protein [Candidatus Binatia bacterium]
MTDTNRPKFGEFDVDPFIIDTLVWLESVRTYLKEMETAIPQARLRAGQKMSEAAKHQNWSEDALQLETDIIESRFDTDLPKLLRYSVVVLLHTIVETQLFRLANHLREKNKFSLKVTDFKGRPFDQAKLYFDKVVNLRISNDPAWDKLMDLSTLRDIIAHRGGRQGIDSTHQETVNKLIGKYKDEIRLIGSPNNPDSEIEISNAFCRTFLDLIENFFDRLFKASGLK